MGNTYTATFTPTGGAGGAGQKYISVGSGVFTDEYGNFNQSTGTFEWFYSPVPTMTISSTAVASGTTTNDTTIDLTFTSSLSTDDFDLGSITLVNGSLNDTLDGTGKTYTATFTPDGPGATSIYVAGGEFTDADGGINTASNTFSWTHTPIPIPTMTIESSTVVNGSSSTVDTISLTFISSAATADFNLGSITLLNGSLNGTLAGTGNLYTATFTPHGPGAASIYVAGTEFTDAEYGISNTASNAFSWTYLNSTSPLSYDIDVTPYGGSAYILTASGASAAGFNTRVSIKVGDTVNFNVTASNHPFFIKTLQGANILNQVSTPPAIGQGSEVGLVSWTPNTEGIYFYVCSSHSEMNGEIFVSY